MQARTKLLGRIGFDHEKLCNDLDAISRFPVIDEEYSEFSSGTWMNNSLWNDDGDYMNTQYKDYNGSATLTDLGKKTPYINEVIEKYFEKENLKMVRTRNLINGQVIPHIDFVELNKENYIRVLIPLETNLDSYHSDQNFGVFRMLKGDIWMLDASVIHAAYNFGYDSRIILCLDFQHDGIKNVTPALVFKDESVHNETLRPVVFSRAPLREEDLEDFIHSVSNSIEKVEDIKPAILKISGAHVHNDIPIHDVYDILSRATKKRKDLYDFCKKIKIYYTVNRGFGERFPVL